MPFIQLTDELLLRSVTEDDYEMLQTWIDADPEHRGISTVEFFAKGRDCWVLMDAEGPVFFLKLSQVIRMDVQFAPGEHARRRTRNGLHQGFPPLGALLAEKGFVEAVFDSKNERLMRSLEKRLAFRRLPGEMRCALGGR